MVAGIAGHQVQGVQEPVNSLLKGWVRLVLRVRDQPIIPRGLHILQCHNKWPKEVIQGLIVTTDRQIIMDHQVNLRACNLRQTQVILQLLTRTLHHRVHHRTDIRQTVSA